MSINFYDTGSDIESKPSLVDEGTYRAVINSVRSRTEKEPMDLSIEYKLENNRRVFQNFRFNDKGQKWISWQLGGLGVLTKAQELAKPNEPLERTVANIHKTINEHYVGKVVTIEVTHTDWAHPITKVKSTYVNTRLIFEDVDTKPTKTKSKPATKPVKTEVDMDEELPF